MKVVFLGDISLNDDYIDLCKENVNPFKSVDSYLSEGDFVVGNLECMVIGNQGVNELKRPRLGTTLETLNYLKQIKLNVACLAQNHVYDHLLDGYKKTVGFLKDSQIRYMGAGLSTEEAQKNIILEKNDIKVGLLNYVTLDTNPQLPGNANVHLNVFDLQKAKNEIAELKNNVSFVVVLLHWGGRVEGGLVPDWDQPKIARQLIDAGADLIVGHHTHTYQSYHVYKGKYVYYSLGNFCFSDITFESTIIPLFGRNKLTTILTVHFGKNDKYKIKTSYFRNHFSHYEPISAKKIVPNDIYVKTVLNLKPLWSLYYMILKKILPIWFFMIRRDLSLRTKLNRIIISIKKRSGNYE